MEFAGYGAERFVWGSVCLQSHVQYLLADFLCGRPQNLVCGILIALGVLPGGNKAALSGAMCRGHGICP